MSGVWEPGPRQQLDFILVTKDGKVQVVNHCLAGQPASPPGQPSGRGLFQAGVSPQGGRSGGGAREPSGEAGEKGRGLGAWVQSKVSQIVDKLSEGNRQLPSR